MSRITFPCVSGRQVYRVAPGTPDRAQHCQCVHGYLSDERDGTCIRCGRHAKPTIDQTFQARARQLARGPKAKA